MVDSISSITSQIDTAQGSGARGKLNQDFDDFLTLLVTQLQNQDPLEPMKSEEFTQQLVSFSQLEQQIAQSEKMDALVSSIDSLTAQSALNYLGRNVVIEGDMIKLNEDMSPVSFTYELDAAADETSISILDANGQVVATADGGTDPGSHIFEWDGLDDNGDPVAPGIYYVSVGAMDAEGGFVNTSTFVAGTVSAIETVDGRNYLVINGELVDESAIQAVS